MKLSKALLGAILLGITVQTTGCKEKELPGPKSEKEESGKKGEKTVPVSCPMCGMG